MRGFDHYQSSAESSRSGNRPRRRILHGYGHERRERHATGSASMWAEPTPTSCCSTRPAAIAGREGVEHAEEPCARCARRPRTFIATGVAPGEIEFFAHGTTITTNALLEMRGAKVGLLITKGYRAVQEVQNQARDGNLFDYFYSKPQPIAPQSLTREIPERSDYCRQGTVAARPRCRAAGGARAEGTPASTRLRSATCSPS